MARTYVPGYGYVDSEDPGTRGSVKPGPKPVVTGQEPIIQNPIYITRPSLPYGAAEEDSLAFQTNTLSDSPLLNQAGQAVTDFFDRPLLDQSAARQDQQQQVDLQARLLANQGQEVFGTEGMAQRVADINDGYVVRQADGTYKVEYGIWAQQARNRDAAMAGETPSNYQNLPVDTTATAPSNYQNLPVVAPGSMDTADGTYIGSTFTTDPVAYAPRYTITQSLADTEGGAVPLLNFQDLDKAREQGDPQGFLVYMGEVTTAGSTGAVFSENYMDSRLISDYMALPDEQRMQVYDLVNRYYPKYWEPSYVQGIWERSVKAASNLLLTQGKKVSPFGIFEETIAAAAAADAERNASSGGSYGGGGYGGGGGGSTTVVLTSPTDAWVILNQAMQQYFGRKASQSEMSKFVKMLNAQERANPVTQEFSGSGVVQSGGFNPQLFAEQYVQGQEGSAEFAAATSFLDAFMGVLDGDTGVL